MPNWCMNELRVTGEADDVAAFVAANRTEELALSFTAAVPEPADLAERPDDGIFPAWYGWRVANWGTKWDLGDGTQLDEVTDDKVVYTFDTAWAPPLPWLEAVSERHPGVFVRLVYTDPAMDFAGVAEGYDGMVETTDAEGDEAVALLQREGRDDWADYWAMDDAS